MGDAAMKFTYNRFSCDVDKFTQSDDVIFRFYDGARVQSQEEIVNLVFVDPGYGYMCLMIKGDSALLSGYLDEAIFDSEEMVDAAIQFVEDFTPEVKNVYMPYHIARVKKTGYVEYNGEY